MKPFEDETGCKVTVQVFGTSDEAFSLFSTNPEKFDVISASGDASLRLVRAGYVQPVNVDLVKNYADIFPALKDKPYNTVDGVHYGVPARPRLEPAHVADRQRRLRPRRPGPQMFDPTSAVRRQGRRSTTRRSTSPTRRSSS